MSNESLQVKSVIHGLVVDRNRYQALNELLAIQRQHIIARNAVAMDAVNEQIMALYHQLTRNSQKRYQLLDELGIQGSCQGMPSLIARLPGEHKLHVGALWHDLQQQAATCQARNDANGALIHMQQEILVNLLNIGEPENWLYQQL
ncbi:flagellar protein FlgN [Citrobacter portucalensis]|uniref:flagellar protein FlgN n=1 Tax=Citrobacter portucalensis TaxID=1639133 RepID=UPI003CE73797